MTKTKEAVAKLAVDEMYRYYGNTQVPVADFIAIKDNPAQRNTEKRALSAKHLFKFDPHHLQVSVGLLPDGSAVKLDGHTRAHLWGNNAVLGLPENMQVNVDVYLVADEAAAVSLYDKFDAKFASDTTEDILFGAVSLIGTEFKSVMMRNLQFNSILNRAFRLCTRKFSSEERRLSVKSGKELDVMDDPYRQRMREMPGLAPLLKKFTNYNDPKNIRELVAFFKEELVALDETDPKKKDYLSSIGIAAIITLMRYPDEAKDFWLAYNQNKGVKDGMSYDGVQAVANIRAHIRQTAGKSEATGDSELVRRVINSFENWRLGEGGFSNAGTVPRPMWENTLRDYIEAGLKRKFQARDRWRVLKKAS